MDLEFLCQNFTQKYVHQDLKNHREHILFERERCFFPETQIMIMNIKKADRVNELIEEQREVISQAYMKIQDLEVREHQLRQGRDIDAGRQKTKFIRKCPDENCKGFLSSAWKCGICELHFCAQCNSQKNDGHECNDNDVETMKLLKKDTKPCPKCGTMIFKISGCDQMWCPDCYTPFSWKTGVIEKGTVHNPHYYEFNRQNDRVVRNPGDIPCGGLPSLYELNSQFGKYHDKLYAYHRAVLHIQHHILRYELVQINDDNADLRLQYMMDGLSELRFKQLLQIRDKANKKKRDWVGIYNLFVDVMSDMYRQLLLKEISMPQFIETSQKLEEYTIVEFRKVSNRYKCVCRTIFG